MEVNEAMEVAEDMDMAVVEKFIKDNYPAYLSREEAMERLELDIYEAWEDQEPCMVDEIVEGHDGKPKLTGREIDVNMEREPEISKRWLNEVIWKQIHDERKARSGDDQKKIDERIKAWLRKRAAERAKSQQKI